MGEFAPDNRLQPPDVEPIVMPIPLSNATPVPGELSFVEGKIITSSQQQDLDIINLPHHEKPRLGLLVGQVLADHTRVEIQNFMNRNPGARPAIRIIPGSTSTQLTRLYDRGIGDITSADRIRRNKAVELQDPLIQKALDRRNPDVYPEVAQADRLRSKWQDDGLAVASDSVSALLASYGARIGAFERAMEERTKDIPTANIGQAAIRRWARQVRDHDQEQQ